MYLASFCLDMGQTSDVSLVRHRGEKLRIAGVAVGIQELADQLVHFCIIVVTPLLVEYQLADPIEEEKEIN